MNEFGISEKSFDLILNTLKKYSEVEEAAIFGSRAKGNYKNGSDIDMVLYGHYVTYKTTTDISAQLNEALPIPYFSDVLNYNTIKEQELITHINNYGKKFYKSTFQTY